MGCYVTVLGLEVEDIGLVKRQSQVRYRLKIGGFLCGSFRLKVEVVGATKWQFSVRG